MASQKLSVFSISLKPGISWNTVIQNLLSNAMEDEHYLISEQSSDYIGGCYVMQAKHNQIRYNVNNQRFESVLIDRQHVLRYDIFPHNGSMMVWGSHKLSSLFITALTLASDNLAIIENRDIDFKKILLKLLNCNDVKFIRMKLHGVLIEEGIVANCSVTLEGRDNIGQLIKKYLDQIGTVTVQIVSGETNTSIMLYSSGAMVIFKDRDNIPDSVIDKIGDIVGRES